MSATSGSHQETCMSCMSCSACHARVYVTHTYICMSYMFACVTTLGTLYVYLSTLQHSKPVIEIVKVACGSCFLDNVCQNLVKSMKEYIYLVKENSQERIVSAWPDPAYVCFVGTYVNRTRPSRNTLKLRSCLFSLARQMGSCLFYLARQMRSCWR